MARYTRRVVDDRMYYLLFVFACVFGARNAQADPVECPSGAVLRQFDVRVDVSYGVWSDQNVGPTKAEAEVYFEDLFDDVNEFYRRDLGIVVNPEFHFPDEGEEVWILAGEKYNNWATNLSLGVAVRLWAFTSDDCDPEYEQATCCAARSGDVCEAHGRVYVDWPGSGFFYRLSHELAHTLGARDMYQGPPAHSDEFVVSPPYTLFGNLGADRWRFHQRNQEWIASEVASAECEPTQFQCDSIDVGDYDGDSDVDETDRQNFLMCYNEGHEAAGCTETFDYDEDGCFTWADYEEIFDALDPLTIDSPIYVDPAATGDEDGGSWTDAFTDIQTAMDNALGGAEIWVKSGNYTLEKRLWLKDAVKLYGGFAGTETVRSQRDPATNATTILGDDLDHHTIVSKCNCDTTVLDGFRLANGTTFDANHRNAGGIGWDGWDEDKDGGALYLSASDAVIANCEFYDNESDRYGGAVAIGADLTASNPTFVNCKFHNNTALDLAEGEAQSGGGGAVYHYYGGGSSRTFHNCLFYENEAKKGGAVFSNGDSIFVNCTFADNDAIDGASDGEGGAMYLMGGATIINSILWGNSANGGSGDQVFVYADPPEELTVSYTDFQGGWTGTGNINANPNFNDPSSDDYHLGCLSACIDAGNNEVTAGDELPPDIADIDDDDDTSEELPLDIFGGVRRFNDLGKTDTGNGTAPIVDMGADERHISCWKPPPW